MNFKARKWSQIVGNRNLKRALKSILRRHQKGLTNEQKPRVLITGPSRSGKTEDIELFLRSLTCQEMDLETLDPCEGTCDVCSQNASQYGITGLYSEFWSGGVEFIPVDCGLHSTLNGLIEKLDIQEIHPSRTRVYFVDEVHRLFPKRLDEALLKTIEQVNAYWFFATAKPDEIDDMFKNRLIEISTELPTTSELAHWLQERAEEFGVDLEPEEILDLCKESNMIPGLALKRLGEIALLS